VSRRAISLAVALVILEAAGAIAIILTSNREHHKLATTVIAVPAGISFVLSGLIALRRRPENRTGFYLAATGYLWLLAALAEANNNVIWTAGVFVGNLAFISFAALLLAFPTGQLRPRPDRVIVRLTAVFVLIGPPLLLLFASHALSCGDSCGESAIVVYRSHTIERIVDVANSALVGALVLAVVIVLVRRWRRASSALRRVLLPVYASAAAALLVLMASNILTPISTEAADVIGAAFVPLFAAVPIAFLLGLLRSRLARASVGQLVLSIGRGTRVRNAIADALGDPSVELAYSVDEGRRLVDEGGRRFILPAEGTGRAATTVERDGRRVGAIVHEESLLEERELLESVAATAALALDHERMAAELRSQYGRLRTLADEQAALRRVAVLVAQQPSPEQVFTAVAEAVGPLLGADLTAMLVYPGDGTAKVIAGWSAAGPMLPVGTHLPLDGDSVSARIFHSRAAARIDGYATVEGDTAAIARDLRLRSTIGAPILVEGGLWGGLMAATRGAEPFPEDAEARIAAFTELVATAVSNAHAREALHLLAEELHASRARLVAAGDDARRRLERNLHDGAQQRLVSLSLALRLAQRKLGGDPQEAAQILDQATGELAQALEELRELARGIHPAVLTDRGLEAALRSLAERTPLLVDVSTVTGRLPDSVEAAAYYIVSEAIANVVKHAHASTVAVRVATPNGRVVVEVSDDGVGGADPAGGSGLRGLADRVAALDGTLWVDAPTDGGTRVMAEIPLTS
jgi:signal transduction histidine kinase